MNYKQLKYEEVMKILHTMGRTSISQLYKTYIVSVNKKSLITESSLTTLPIRISCVEQFESYCLLNNIFFKEFDNNFGSLSLFDKDNTLKEIEIEIKKLEKVI